MSFPFKSISSALTNATPATCEGMTPGRGERSMRLEIRIWLMRNGSPASSRRSTPHSASCALTATTNRPDAAQYAELYAAYAPNYQAVMEGYKTAQDATAQSKK
jgi:hypothetical protein